MIFFFENKFKQIGFIFIFCEGSTHFEKAWRSSGEERARCVFVPQKPLDHSWRGPLNFLRKFLLNSLYRF